MTRRWLGFQLCFNFTGVGLCLASLFGDALWTPKLLATGVGAIMVGGLFQMLGFRHRVHDPVDRLLQGANEALPGVAISIIDPLALVCTTVAVLFALVAGGMNTVLTSNRPDGDLPDVKGQSFRVLATGVLILALSLVALQHLRIVDFELALNATTTEWITLVASMWFLVSMRGVIDLIIAASRSPKN